MAIGATVEREVQGRRQIAEEFGRQVVRLVQDPDGQNLLGVGQIDDARLELAPELRTQMRRGDAEGEGEAAVPIEGALGTAGAAGGVPGLRWRQCASASRSSGVDSLMRLAASPSMPTTSPLCGSTTSQTRLPLS